jgi:hypothetical protein
MISSSFIGRYSYANVVRMFLVGTTLP